jgi:hypothetical protein
MDEGEPIAYLVLERGVPVFASGGEQVATVDHVVAAPEQDIFHGVVIRTARGARFVDAAEVSALHERGVDLRIAADDVQGLPPPHGAARSYSVDPAGRPSAWGSLVDRLTGRGGWRSKR